MISNIVKITPLQHLVPGQPSICREEDAGLVMKVVPHVATGQYHARGITASQDPVVGYLRDNSKAMCREQARS